MTDSGSDRPADESDRKTPRRRVFLAAIIVYRDLSASYRCFIRDRSETGARIKLPGRTIAPHQFWMIDVAQGLAYDATVAWRREQELGVDLTDPIDVKRATNDRIQRGLHALWIETAPRAGDN